MNTVSIPDRVESQTQSVKLGFVVDENDEDFNSYTYVEDMTEDQLATVAKRYAVSPELLKEINGHLDSLREAIHNDLADIWAKVTAG